MLFVCLTSCSSHDLFYLLYTDRPRKGDLSEIIKHPPSVCPCICPSRFTNSSLSPLLKQIESLNLQIVLIVTKPCWRGLPFWVFFVLFTFCTHSVEDRNWNIEKWCFVFASLVFSVLVNSRDGVKCKCICI